MNTDRLLAFAPFLAECIRSDDDAPRLHKHLCRHLMRAGLPIWRSALLLETLDPEISGGRSTWSRDGSEELQVIQNLHTADLSDAYARSPLKIVDDTGQPFRHRLDVPRPDMPLLGELKEEGATDYLMVPLDFTDRRRSAAISFATDQEGGFTDEEIHDLEIAAALISPVFEVRLLRRIAVNLINTYVGRQAGASILDGSIKRGDGGRMRAAIWYSDLRNFTRLTETMETSTLLDLLNEYFEIITAAASKRGGEVVQHIGDAILLYFVIPDETAAAAVCTGALEAAEEALVGLAEANERRREAGMPQIHFGIGLDLGQVTHGNVGSLRRLSFNVVGPAVNRAARIETLTKAMGTSLLMSGEFAARTSRPWLSVGWHALKGVPEPLEIARLPD